MPRLTPCSSCHSHVLADERACPHCGATLRPTSSAKVPIVLMGLALAGCPAVVGEPEYGVPDTSDPDTMTTTADSGTAESGTAGATDTGTDTGTSTAGEPEYGVPDTGP